MQFNMKITTLVALAVLASGCAGKATKQGFDVVAPPRFVTKEEAVGFIQSSDEYAESREQLDAITYPEGVSHNGISNHPALVGQGGEFVNFTVRKEESLISTANRLQLTGGFKRLIFDITPGTPISSAIASDYVKVVGGKTLFGEVAHVYRRDIPKLKFYAARDAEGMSLIVSNKHIPRWQQLMVFEVQVGMLGDNANSLARVFGWKAIWETDNYMIEHAYPMVIKEGDIEGAMNALLLPYSVTPVLNPNTRAAHIVSASKARSLPYTKPFSN